MEDVKDSIKRLISELKKVNVENYTFESMEHNCHEFLELQGEIKRIVNDFVGVIEETDGVTRRLNDAYKIIEKSPVVVFQWTLDEDVPTHYVSQNVRQYGYEPDDFYSGHLKDYWTFIHEEDRSIAKQRVYNARERKISDFQHQYRIQCADGSCRWVEEHTFIEFDEANEPLSEKGILYDITDLKRMEERIVHNENRYRSLFEKAPAIMMTLDLTGRITSLNHTGEKILGYRKKEWFSKPIDQLIVRGQLQLNEENNWAQLTRKNSQKAVELIIRCKDGSERVLSMRLNLLRKNRKPFEVQAIAQDITKRKQTEEHIRFLSFHDKLTGLYNRAYFDEKIRQIDTAGNYPYSVIIGDMNGLKETNDLFGHKAGDQLLVVMAEILKQSCRNADIICRFGGDEFAVILPSTDTYGTKIICNRIRENCEAVDYGPIKPSIALGYSTKFEEGVKFEEIIKEADDTMYRNKLNVSKSMRSSMIMSLKTSLEEKTMETKDHAERIKEMALILGKRLSLSDSQLDDLAIASMMHDIGKIGIPDSILMKNGSLTKDEWLIMKKHSEIGANILNTSPNMKMISNYIMHHHERWDGKGYPAGIKGIDIPIISRIITVVDAYDVMTHKRSYSIVRTQEQAINELLASSGTQFDPYIVDEFKKMVELGELNQGVDIEEMDSIAL